MVPTGNAKGNSHGSSWIVGQKDVSSPIVLQAAKVAIHVRPRSPGWSPSKYLPIDTSLGTRADVRSPKDSGSWPVLHLEVEQPHANSIQHGSPKQGPRAVVDVVHVQSRRVPPAPAPPVDASSAAVSIKVLPSGKNNGTVASVPTGNPSSALQGVSTVHRPVSAALPAVQAISHKSRNQALARKTGSIQTTVGAAAAPALVCKASPAAAAASIPPHLTAKPEDVIAAVGAAAAAPPTLFLSTDQPPRVPTRTAKGSGAALLAELLGSDIVLQPAPQQQQPSLQYAAAAAHINAPDPRSVRLGPTNLASKAWQTSVHPGVTAAEGSAMAVCQESASLLWSWDQGLAAAAAAGLPGIPDPEETARRARRRHRKRVARIVVDHWKQFAREGLRAVAARRHLRRRLLTAAWVAWLAEAASARSRMRLAAVCDMKRSYLKLSRCVQAWSAAAKRLTSLQELQERVTVNRLLRQSRACLRAWRRRCYYAAEKRRRQLQAWFYYCFSTLTRALRKWHVWGARRRAKARRAAWADEQHVERLGRKALAALRHRLALRLWKAQAVELADRFRRRWALRAVFHAWHAAASACRDARVVAVAALAAAAARLQSQVAAAAFTEWKRLTGELRRRRQRGGYGMAYMRRWRQLVVIWAWRQRVARTRHLGMCEREVQRVGRRVRLRLSWSRWCLAVEMLQGQRNAELRAAVLSRACWATWRAVVEHGAAKRELQRIASQRVARVVATGVLAAWRDRSAQWQAKAARWMRAVAWHRRRALERLLKGWRREASRMIAKAAAAQVAQRHRRRHVLYRALRVWRRFAWRQYMKMVISEYYSGRLLRGALLRWLRHARYKARREVDRRRAVRHRYLTLLHNGLLAFRSALARRLAKQKDCVDLARLHSLHVARSVMRAWRQEYMTIAVAKRAVARRAALQRRMTLLRHALSVWMQETARLSAQHARLREVAGFAALQLLRRTLRRWSAVRALLEERREAKAAQLAAVIAALETAVARRLLAAWRDVHEDLIMKRFQDSRARAFWRDRSLRRAMTSWALYLARHRVTHLLTARALGAYRGRIWRAVLGALGQHAERQRFNRRLAAVALEHRRRGLLRRSISTLAWYAKYRAAKARRYIAARALYVRRLQREGAAEWLQVGLERRQQRIELLAAQQARSLAQQLARVEPFARRWLNAVRGRRRHASWTLPADATRRAGAIAPPSALEPLGNAAGMSTLSPWPLEAVVATRTRRYEPLHWNSTASIARTLGAAAKQLDRQADNNTPNPQVRFQMLLADVSKKPVGGVLSAAVEPDGTMTRANAAAWNMAAASFGTGGLNTWSGGGGGDGGTGGRGGGVFTAISAAAQRRPPPRTPPGSTGVSPPTPSAMSGLAPMNTAAAITSSITRFWSGSPPRATAWQPHTASNDPNNSGETTRDTCNRSPPRCMAKAALSGPTNWPGLAVDKGQQIPISAVRVRPSPRCPDFLMRRPVTVGSEKDRENLGVPYGRPASSMDPRVGSSFANAGPGSGFGPEDLHRLGSNAGAEAHIVPLPGGSDLSPAAVVREPDREVASLQEGGRVQRAQCRGGGGMGGVGGAGAGHGALPVFPGQRPPPAPLYFANPWAGGLEAAASEGGVSAAGHGAQRADGNNPRGAMYQELQPASSPFAGSWGHLDRAATVSATAPPVSPAISLGIAIHRPGPRPPDIFRLPTRGGETAGEDSDSAGGGGKGSNLSDSGGGSFGGFGGSPVVEPRPALLISLGPNQAAAGSAAVTSGLRPGKAMTSFLPSETTSGMAAVNVIDGQRPNDFDGLEVVAATAIPPRGAGGPKQATTGKTDAAKLGVKQQNPGQLRGNQGGEKLHHQESKVQEGHGHGGSGHHHHHHHHRHYYNSLYAQGYRQAGDMSTPSFLDEGELAELESVLLHCKRLKELLYQLEEGDKAPLEDLEKAAAVGAVLMDRGKEERPLSGDGGGGAPLMSPGRTGAAAEARHSGTSLAIVAQRQQHAAEVRAALAALWPTVKYAAERLHHVRGLAG